MRKLIKKGEKGLSLPSLSSSLMPGPFGYTSKPTLSFDTDYADNLKKGAQNLNNTISNNILSLKLSDDPEKRKLGYDMGVQNIKSEVDKGSVEFKDTLNQYKSPGAESPANKPSIFSKLMNFKGMNTGLQIGGTALDMIPSMDKTHNENDQLGENIRGTIEDAFMKSGNPYAMAAGVASKIIGKTGGYTDGSKGLGTTNDTLNTIASFAVPGAGWFTKKTKEIEKDAVLQASSGYTGVTDNVNTAAQNAGAKILFERNKANAMIANAIYQKDKAREILDRAEMDRYSSANPLINQRVQMQLSGGYNPLLAKDGTKLYNIEFAKRALSRRKKKREETIPQDVGIYKSGGKTRSLEELIQYAKEENPRFIQRMSEPLRYVSWTDSTGTHNGTHMLGYAEQDGKYIIFPSIAEKDGVKGNPLVYYSDWKEALDNALKNKDYLEVPSKEEAEIFTKSDSTDSGYKKGWTDFFSQSFYNTTPDSVVSYKSGGSFNIIPEGALHKNKHHLEDIDSKFEDVTSKGIPVISESEGGDITQHAEVEKEEIIFRLEVTKKLEELARENTDDAALEAGKLLVKEILYNTIDKTNSML